MASRILFPYPRAQLPRFVAFDLDVLRERHDVRQMECGTPWQMLSALGSAATCDLLLCWFGSIRYLPLVVMARLFGAKVIIIAGGYDVAASREIPYGNMRGGLSRVLGRLLFSLAHRVVPFSHAAAAECVSNAGVSPKRITVLYLGVDRTEGSYVPASDKQRLVVTIGVLNESSIIRKGILSLIQASKLLPDVQFVIAGGGDAAALTRLAREAGSNVQLPGIVSDMERNALYSRARVYCQLSLHEGFGFAVAESMLYNCIPVTSRRGSLPEVAGEWGRYVDPHDVSEVARTIALALEVPYSPGSSPRDSIVSRFDSAHRRVQLLQIVAETLGFPMGRTSALPHA